MKKVEITNFRGFSLLCAAGLGCFALLAHADGGDDIQAGDAIPVTGDILVIGDSHSAGTFGRALDQDLRHQYPQAKVSIYASASATPDYFFRDISSHGGFYRHTGDEPASDSTPRTPEMVTPRLTTLLAQNHPKVTVVALGTNLIGYGEGDIRRQIGETIQAIKNSQSQCVWVGPPDLRPDTPRFSGTNQEHIYDLLKSVTSDMGCRLIDSRKYTQYPRTGGHGIHYDDLGQAGIEKGRAWAGSVVRDITQIVAGGGGSGAGGGQP